MKCSVGRTRNRSAGSIGPAARAVPDPAATSTSAMVAVSASRTRLRLSRLDACVGRLASGTRENDAQDQRGDAEKAGADEKERVAFEQRAPGRQPLHHDSRESFGEFPDVGIRGA